MHKSWKGTFVVDKNSCKSGNCQFGAIFDQTSDISQSLKLEINLDSDLSFRSISGSGKFQWNNTVFFSCQTDQYLR